MRITNQGTALGVWRSADEFTDFSILRNFLVYDPLVQKMHKSHLRSTICALERFSDLLVNTGFPFDWTGDALVHFSG